MGRTGTTLGLAAVMALTACTGEGSTAPETTPDGAVVLTENAPFDVSGSSVVATGIEGSAATLRISEDGSPSTPTDVEAGDDVTVGGETYRVEAVWSEGDSGEPGGQGGRVMIVPTP